MKLIFPNIVGTIDVYMDCMRAICGDTAGKSMIDLCCCFAPNTPKLGFEFRRYVDIIDRKLDHPEEQQFFTKANIIDLPNEVIKYYNVAICSDGIEHFTKLGGHQLINIMKSYSFKQIIFTPLGEIFPLHNTTPDDPEAHHSLWTPEDFPGWATIVFPDYHKEWNGGAFFATNGSALGLSNKNEFERIIGCLSDTDWFKEAYNNSNVHIERS